MENLIRASIEELETEEDKIFFDLFYFGEGSGSRGRANE